MSRLRLPAFLPLVFGLLLVALPARAQTGTVELVVRATPTGGRAEKVMRQSFYLLRASLRSIEAQARTEVGEADRDTFVDSLEVSAELKAWMKRTRRFELRGEEFTRSLTPDDILNVPEFFDAYQERNIAFVGFGFPKRKAKPKDQARNPKKWAESEKRYRQEVRAYIELHPDSKQGLDEHLTYIDSAARWKAAEQQHAQRVRQHTIQLVEGRFTMRRVETDLEGRARFDNLPPGPYWVTNLWTEVRAGDVTLNWDLGVEVAAGQTVYLELNNANARLP